jgi:tetratricopeptide (TPR) repeat protein
MVLALARPEVRDIFPRLWAARGRKEISLSGLNRKASERLVHQVLGKQIDAATVSRIVEQAAGNALYLEELVRAVAEGKGDELPKTVLAMLQVRLSRFSPGMRRALRFASVFGATFWSGGVLSLLGQDVRAEEIESWLGLLVDEEVIERRHPSRYPTEMEYAFRHALMRDAAYAMLTDADRALGHRLASRYLEGAGEHDPMILADHAREGGDLERAAPLYLRATEQAFACEEWEAVRRRAAHGIASGASGAVLSDLCALDACAVYYQSDAVLAHRLATDALALVPHASLNWCRLVGILLVIAPQFGHMDQFQQLVVFLEGAEPAPEARLAYIEAASMLIIMFSCIGQRAPAAALLARATKVGAGLLEREATARGYLGWARGTYALYMEPDPWQARTFAEQAVLAFTEVASLHNVAMNQFFLGLAQATLGDREASEETLRSTLDTAVRRQDFLVQTIVKSNWPCLLTQPDGHVDPGRAEDVRRLVDEVLATEGTVPSLLGHAHGYLARLLLSLGEVERAEAEARKAMDLMAQMPVLRPAHSATLIHILLHQGRLSEAQEVATEGLRVIEDLGGTGYTEIGFRLAAAISFHAAGDIDGRARVIREARDQVHARADRIPDASARERFLTQVPENARVLELARTWLGA